MTEQKQEPILINLTLSLQQIQILINALGKVLVCSFLFD